MKNEYEIRGEITAIFLKRRSGEIVETIIDTKDLPLVKTFPNTWCANWFEASKSFYVACSTKKGTVYLHRFLLNFPENMVVDHINHDTLNNTRTNLRVITKSENGKHKKRRFSKMSVYASATLHCPKCHKSFTVLADEMFDHDCPHCGYGHKEVYGECAGCGEDIVEGEGYYEMDSTGEVLKVHQRAECCFQFVGEMSYFRTAGEG